MNTLIVIVSVFGCAVFLWFLHTIQRDGYKDGYKYGQIDALNGKIKYQKEENEDGETVWTKIKESTPPKG